MDNFTVLPEHIKLLQATYFGWIDCEFGGLAMDCKRPFGNSDVFSDMAEILGMEIDPENGANSEQQDIMSKLYSQLDVVLAINLDTCVLQAGIYEPYQKENSRYGWKKII